MTTRLRRAWKCLWRWRRNDASPMPAITLKIDVEGVRKYSDGTLLFAVAWRDVEEVVAWKEDNFAFDTINLGFRRKGSTEILAFDEDEDKVNWLPLVDSIEKRFAVSSEWLNSIAVPAFETKWSSLWGKPSNPETAWIRKR